MTTTRDAIELEQARRRLRDLAQRCAQDRAAWGRPSRLLVSRFEDALRRVRRLETVVDEL